jgi:hypothetical protein
LRSAVGVAVALSVLAVSVSASARTDTSTAGRIYFYANVAEVVPGSKFIPNPPLIRPARLIEHPDGSWLIVNLRWASWGGATARATGISSASDCNPNCAVGNRSHDPAQLVLSRPKRFLGRRVYTCFRLTIPASPTANQHNCLGRAGSLYLYMPVRG